MGVYLPKPKTTKLSDDGGEFPTTSTRFGVAAMQGWRLYMEDAHLADPDFYSDTLQHIGLFGVFDGHGGAAVSSWVSTEFKRVLHDEIEETARGIADNSITPKRTDFNSNLAVACEALRRTFLRLDVEMSSPSNRDALKRLHQEVERKKREEQNEDDKSSDDNVSSKPTSFVDALLSHIGGHHPLIRVFERNGQRFYGVLADSSKRNGTSEAEYKPTTEDATTRPNLSIASPDSGEESECQTFATEKQNVSAEINSSGVESARSTATSPHLETAAVDTAKLESCDEGSEPYQPEACGTTAIVAMVVGGQQPYLITANAGDSRAVLCRNGTAIALSIDHKPILKGEARRILNAGGKVINGRVDGNLNLSRALGDLYYKNDATITPDEQKLASYTSSCMLPQISAVPDIRVVSLEPGDQFVILACDGIWDCLTNQQAVNFVQLRLQTSDLPPDSVKLSRICEQMCDFCLSENPLQSEGGVGCDNMTVMIVLLGEHMTVGFKSATAVQHGEVGSCSTDFIQFYGRSPDEEDFKESDAAWESKVVTGSTS